VTGNLVRYIRFAEIAVIGVLAIFALVTWRELTALRKAPVVLPSYVFETSNDAGQGPMIVSRGTWITSGGRVEPMQTVTIECRKARMECVESAAAVVFIGGRGLLESKQTTFEISHWNNAEIVTKPSVDRCGTRVLVLDQAEKKTMTRVSASQEKGLCKDLPERTLELVAGYRARDEVEAPPR
jgi:hypothetical protein